MNKNFLVVFERAAEDNWGAWVPDIPGAVGAGDSRQAALQSVLLGVEAQLEYGLKKNQPLPEPTSKVLDVSEFDASPETGHYEIEWLSIDLAPYAPTSVTVQQAA